MLLLDYYVLPDYNSLLNIRHSLLKLCKSNSFLLKHQIKTLQHTKNININIADCITVQKYLRRQLINAFSYRKRLFVFVHQELFPFYRPAAAARYCSSCFYTLQQCCLVNIVENQQTSLSLWAFLCHIMSWSSDLRETFLLPWKQPLRQEVGQRLV